MTKSLQAALKGLFNRGYFGFAIQDMTSSDKATLKDLVNVGGITFYKLQEPSAGKDWIFAVSRLGQVPYGSNQPQYTHCEKMYSEIQNYCS